MRLNFPFLRRYPAWLAVALACAYAPYSQAALFEDNEARRAILEMRQRVDAMQQSSQRATDDNAQLRRSLLDLQSQIDGLKAELSSLRGQNEQLARDVAEMQRRQKDMAQGVDERLRQFEPIKVTVDGQQFQVEPNEKRDYEAALARFRDGKYAEAQGLWVAFLKQYPGSGYVPSARFWLGNAQYATRDYKEAVQNFRAILAAAPQHARAPEAMLSIANCQIELKEVRGARKTLEDLLHTYPQSEAAPAAKERLARLK